MSNSLNEIPPSPKSKSFLPTTIIGWAFVGLVLGFLLSGVALRFWVGSYGIVIAPGLWLIPVFMILGAWYGWKKSKPRT